MIIYKSDGTELLTILVEDDSYRYREIMSRSELTLYFSMTDFVEIPIGSYVDFKGERFYLFDKTNFKKNSSRDREYTLILYGIGEKLNTTSFFNYIDGRLIFPYTAKVSEHLDLIIQVLNIRDSGWSAGAVDSDTEIVVNYNMNNCLEAVGMICIEAKTEFEITPGKVIHIRKTEYNKESPLALAYGKGNGLKPGVERKNKDNARPIERLYVQGGDRNIDYSTYGSKFLLLPSNQQLVYNGRTYQASADGRYIQRTDKPLSTNFDGRMDVTTIYPSRICTVSAVEIESLEDHFYNVIDNSIPEALDYSDYLIAGKTMSIVYQKGMLTGKEFEVSYSHEFRRFSIVPKEIDGQTMPGGFYIPEVGDTFAVFGCTLPAAYIRDDATKTGASWDMFREAAKYMYEHEEDTDTYGGDISSIWMKANSVVANEKIIIGGYCSLTDPELGGVLIRIKNIKDYVNNPDKVEIDLSNTLVSPTITSTINKLAAYTASLGIQQLIEAINNGQANGQDVTLLQQWIEILQQTAADGGDLADILDKINNDSYVDTQTRLIRGEPIWVSGLTYETTDFVYRILGVPYSCPAVESITLQDSDPNNGRIDVFFLDTYGNFNVKTGTPSANPLKPTLSELELYVSDVYIGAGALEPSNITQEVIYDEKTAGEWTPTATTDAGKTTIDLEAINEPFSGNKHIKIKINVPDETVSLPVHYIGEKYQGGKIFWLASNGKSGLIAAETDTVTDVFWSRLSGFAEYGTLGRATAIGSGQANTAAMLATPAAAGQAVRWVDELIIDGYDDWFIGSEKEMLMLWTRRNKIGNFNPTKDYWTSTEKDWNEARRIDWETGTAASRDKNTRRNVRAIRAFDDNALPSSTQVEYYTPIDTAIVFQAPGEVLGAEGILSFKMKSSLPWRYNSILRIETYKGAVRTGSCAVSPAIATFGFDVNKTDIYQVVAIFHANFALSQSKFDGLKFSLIGSWPNDIELLVDSVRFQHTTALQERATGATLQIQDQIIVAEDWTLNAETGLYEYVYENANIKATSTVDIIPGNEYISIINDAVFLPEIDSSEGQVILYAENAPTDDIVVTVNITEGTL